MSGRRRPPDRSCCSRAGCWERKGTSARLARRSWRMNTSAASAHSSMINTGRVTLRARRFAACACRAQHGIHQRMLQQALDRGGSVNIQKAMNIPSMPIRSQTARLPHVHTSSSTNCTSSLCSHRPVRLPFVGAQLPQGKQRQADNKRTSMNKGLCARLPSIAIWWHTAASSAS